MVKSKITFINPNEIKDIEQYLPKILAEAVINLLNKQRLNKINA